MTAVACRGAGDLRITPVAETRIQHLTGTILHPSTIHGTDLHPVRGTARGGA